MIIYIYMNKNKNYTVPARQKPKVYDLFAGQVAIFMAKRLVNKLARSDNMCAASVIMAKLFDKYPPM